MKRSFGVRKERYAIKHELNVFYRNCFGYSRLPALVKLQSFCNAEPKYFEMSCNILYLGPRNPPPPQSKKNSSHDFVQNVIILSENQYVGQGLFVAT